MPRLEALEDRTVLSTLTVVNSLDHGSGSLRQAILDAHSGDTIDFVRRLRGETIKLTSGELVINRSLDIEGLGADQLTIRGNGAGRVFDLTGSGADVIIAGLTIADGMAAQGGGIENNASNLTLADDELSNNQAIGSAGTDAEGGAVFNGSAATLAVRESVFADNRARGGDGLGGGSAGSGYGGALFNAGSATLSDDTLRDSEAIGGASTGLGGSGFGGAIWNDPGGVLTIRDGSFRANQAIGGVHGKALPPGNPFSVGDGGAIFNAATLDVRNSTFDGNQSHGGAGLNGVAGGGGASAAIKSGGEDDDPPAQTTVLHCLFTNNQAIGGAGGAGAVGGQGTGGAFLADHGANVLHDCTFLGNEAIGGAGGAGANGGPGRAGALRVGPRDGSVSALATDCFFAGNEAIGGAAGVGGVGGLAEGGAIANVQIIANNNTSSLTILDCVLTDNEAVGGAGTVGGVARGGGISTEGGPTLTTGGISSTIVDSRISRNEARGGDGSAGNGGNGLGGGVFVDAHATLTLTDSRITLNEADGGSGGGGSDGQGVGGGVYVTPGGTASKDEVTVIKHNHASTNGDDVFGSLS
jgi:hypothetical protein